MTYSNLPTSPNAPPQPGQSGSRSFKKDLIRLLIVVGASYFAVGFAGFEFGRVQSYNNLDYTLLSKDELKETRLDRVTLPIDILLRIVPAKEIPKLCDDWAFACTITQLGHVCTIYLPAGDDIVFYPPKASAHWRAEDSVNDDLLAHEILHCYYPNWHDPFNKVVEASRKKN